MSLDIDATRLSLLLNDLRLPAIKQIWSSFAERSDTEGWPAARLLMALPNTRSPSAIDAESNVTSGTPSSCRARHWRTSNFDAVPMVSRAHVSRFALAMAWLRNGTNLILLVPSGGGKSHLSSAIGLSLLEKGWKVLFARTTDLVKRLQAARRELALESAINRLDRFDLVILDDFAYVSKDQAETSVLFELISARYERRSLCITANQPFGEWDKVFPDRAMTVAAVDRLVHHSTIFELNVESYRRRLPAAQAGGDRDSPASRGDTKERWRPPTQRISTASTSPNDPLFSS